MKKVIHRSEERGKGDHGWLKTRYSFSFADWYEPNRMGFGMLRVINDDVIGPSSGFGMHSHWDMEIITIVTAGAVTHEDSMGNAGVVPAGDIQAMSAGTGVTHSERNDSSEEPLTLFQIWIQPKERGVAPRYSQESFNLEGLGKGFTLVVGPDGTNGTLPIHQDAYISYAVSDNETPLSYHLKKSGNGVYLFVIDGSIIFDGEMLNARDAAGISDAEEIAVSSPGPAKALFIEVPLT